MEIDQQLRFIGTIHSELKDLQDCPRQEKEGAPAATIEIFDEFIEGLKNIQAGDQLILFTWLHKADRTVLETRPRNDNNLPLTGVFSTRSPDRPNPIGIHFVKVVEVLEDNQFTVSNLEVLDGTPLIDIKPDLRN
jgi:tRNA-Thr(GGU) m(6)t(6)A37 methyltransferase TsaA